jgi:hypothetical protein
MANSIYKRQTRPLVREGAQQEQDRHCHTSNKDPVVSPKWVLYSKTDWPADRRSQHKTQTQLDTVRDKTWAVTVLDQEKTEDSS